MTRTVRVKLISPAKIGGERLPIGATPEVTPKVALQLAEMGAIEATPSEIEEAKAALGIVRDLDVDAIEPIVDLMKGDQADALKTDAGNWSAAKIGTALGRKVAPDEIEAAAKLIELME